VSLLKAKARLFGRFPSASPLIKKICKPVSF
jgi:hypothetical protein